MYNALTALLYKAGIKCENHSASIILLRELFGAAELAKAIGRAKKERVDKQYYVESMQRAKVTEESCKEMILQAEDFIVKMRFFIGRTNNDDMTRARLRFKQLVA